MRLSRNHVPAGECFSLLLLERNVYRETLVRNKGAVLVDKGTVRNEILLHLRCLAIITSSTLTLNLIWILVLHQTIVLRQIGRSSTSTDIFSKNTLRKTNCPVTRALCIELGLSG